MNMFKILMAASLIMLNACGNSDGESSSNPQVYAVGAMREVMWKGDLSDKVMLDSLSPKKGLYGIGPASQLTGEILISDGLTYVSMIGEDSSMLVDELPHMGAPFFVYTNIDKWQIVELPDSIKLIQHLEEFIQLQAGRFKGPFAFKLQGRVTKALIHVQNLAPGTEVRSPEDAHQGQVNFELGNTDAEIIGFYSENHQGVFTHHDSYVHMHLITSDKSYLGHLDAVEVGEMKLLLPD